jgi:hypothetical protein
LLAASVVIGSCTKYLDREPESIISEKTAFQNFNNFQGFIEQMYSLIPDIMKNTWVASFNWGEDEITTLGGNAERAMVTLFDRGNFRAYIGNQENFLDRNIGDPFDRRMQTSIWRCGWQAIRLANQGLEALEKGYMVDATQAEKDIVAGQCYYMRAWWHFQIISYWGGMPYIDTVLPSDEQFSLPRLTYQETADRITEDFRKAVDLLPINWDDTEIGRRTAGQNALRPNKIWALGFLGKNLLFAGSPLMENGVGGPKTYNVEYSKQAADVLGELLALVESGQTQYSLVPFENYSTLFYTQNQQWAMPGSTEAIVRSQTYSANSHWRQEQAYQHQAIAAGDEVVLTPTANYVNYYGMANGLPLDDPESGFDPNFPWRGRDPRFYQHIIYDGVRITQGASPYQYANLYTGGNYRDDPAQNSRTGYLNYKFIPKGANEVDGQWDYGSSLHLHLAWMRLADVYIMYAEAAAQGYGGANGKSPKFSKTAVEALNVIRDRCGLAHVHEKFTTSLDAFMGEVRRDRAVELSFEGHRFNDLRRWLLLTEYPYNIKTSHEFDRARPLDTSVDTSENEVRNFREVTILTRPFSNKHYWMPLKTEDVSIYPEFGQNPGW